MNDLIIEVKNLIDEFMKNKTLKIGHRVSSDKFSNTYKMHELFIKELKKRKIVYYREKLKAKNDYATLSGGFWNEYRYYLVEVEKLPKIVKEVIKKGFLLNKNHTITYGAKKKLDEAVENGILGYEEEHCFTPECYYFKNNENEALRELHELYMINTKYNLGAIKKHEFKKTLEKKYFGGKDLKIGDIIVHKNSFNVEMYHKVIGFKKDNIFINWDCYWMSIKEDEIIKIKKG